MNTDPKVNQTLIRCSWSYEFSSKFCKHMNLWLCRQLESSAGFRFCFVSCQKRRAARRLPGTVFIINTILHRATGVCAPHPAAQGNFTSNKIKSRPIYQTHREFFFNFSSWFPVPIWNKRVPAYQCYCFKISLKKFLVGLSSLSILVLKMGWGRLLGNTL